MNDSHRYMFDTVAFSFALDTDKAVELLTRYAQNHGPIFATHTQWDELNNTCDPERRSQLICTFQSLLPSKDGSSSPGRIPTESSVWDVSAWDQAKWGSGDGLYEAILKDLNQYKNKKNNIQDALIAETAIRNKLVVVTDDFNLEKTIRRNGGDSIRFEELMKRVQESCLAVPQADEKEVGLGH